jgi:hypothetical protein
MGDDELLGQREVSISLEMHDFGGVWANFARVAHSEHEFTIDFVRLDYTASPLQGKVVARVNVSPLFVTQLIAALQDNWDKYARKAMPPEVRDDDDG